MTLKYGNLVWHKILIIFLIYLIFYVKKIFKHIQGTTTMSTRTTTNSNSNLYNETMCEYEYGSKTINCSSGVIKILSAFYGRADNTTCCPYSYNCIDIACYSNKTEYYKNICDSFKTCTIQNYIFEDPCVGTYKYIRVNWECTSKIFFYDGFQIEDK
jgi:hypothetical protein